MFKGFPDGVSGKEPTCQFRRHGFDPWVEKIPWKRAWQPTLVFLPGESLDRGAWRATVHRVAKSKTRLKWLSSHAQVLQRTLSRKKKKNKPDLRMGEIFVNYMPNKELVFKIYKEILQLDNKKITQLKDGQRIQRRYKPISTWKDAQYH